MSSLFRHKAMDAATARRLLLEHCAAVKRAREMVRKGRSVGPSAVLTVVKLTTEGRRRWEEIKRR